MINISKNITLVLKFQHRNQKNVQTAVSLTLRMLKHVIVASFLI